MTTIVMVEGDAGIVQIAADSQLTGADKITSPHKKVFARNGVVYGVAGSQNYINALRHHLELPKAPSRGGEDEWVERTLVPALRRVFDKIDPDRAATAVMSLFAVNGKVFEIDGRLAWYRNTTGRYAVGSGSFFALGALSASASPALAVEIAAMHDPGTGGPTQVCTNFQLLRP